MGNIPPQTNKRHNEYQDDEKKQTDPKSYIAAISRLV